MKNIRTIQPPRSSAATLTPKRKSVPQPLVEELKISVPKSLSKLKDKIKQFVTESGQRTFNEELERKVKDFLKELTGHDYVLKVLDKKQLHIYDHHYTFDVKSDTTWSEKQKAALFKRITKG